MKCINMKITFLSNNLNILNFWNDNKNNFPLLCQLLTKYFCIQGSSSSPERCFSAMGRIITQIRSSLLPETVFDIMLLKSNSEKW